MKPEWNAWRQRLHTQDENMDVKWKISYGMKPRVGLFEPYEKQTKAGRSGVRVGYTVRE